MKKCSSCNIQFNIEEKYCPLCQNLLKGNSEEILFPQNIRYKTNSLILKILLFISSVIFLVIGFIELIIREKIKIDIYVGLGLVTNYVIIRLILKNYQNVYKMIGKYGITVNFLLIIWFAVIRSTIITNYIIPSVCIFELMFNFIVGMLLRKNYLIKYSGQILMNIFLLILPMIIVFLKLTTNNIMSYICCLLSIITILVLLIFFKNEIKEELIKIFNL